jgi:hypothetical protein
VHLNVRICLRLSCIRAASSKKCTAYGVCALHVNYQYSVPYTIADSFLVSFFFTYLFVVYLMTLLVAQDSYLA